MRVVHMLRENVLRLRQVSVLRTIWIWSLHCAWCRARVHDVVGFLCLRHEQCVPYAHSKRLRARALWPSERGGVVSGRLIGAMGVWVCWTRAHSVIIAPRVWRVKIMDDSYLDRSVVWLFQGVFFLPVCEW